MSSTLTSAAMDELADLLKLSRRRIAEIYRDYRLGSTASEIADARGDDDPRKVEDTLSALRVLFGRQTLPKKAAGRQQAIDESLFWMNSDVALSDELQEHFNKILVLAKRTNLRKVEYEPPKPVLERAEQRKKRPNGADGRQAGVYIITRQSFFEDSIGKPKILVKIGHSGSVWERISSAQTWFPEPLEILRVYLVDDPKPVEMKFHVILDTLGQKYEAGGGVEWFETSLSLIDSIAESLDLRDCSKDITPYET